MQRLSKTLSMLAFALVFMAGTAFAQDNEASIDQVSVPDADHDATVVQTGKSNDTQIEQVSVAPPLFGGHTASATQTGNRNTVRQTQDGGAGNEAEATQTGNDNFVRQEQGRNGNDAEVTQFGSRNRALQFQDMKTSVDASNNDAVIIQDGDDNFARQDQDLARNDATIEQRGDDNRAEQSQNGVSSGIGQNIADTFQHGFGHDAYTEQIGGVGFADRPGNEGYIVQNGNDQVAHISQNGPANTANITQSNN